MSPRRRLPTRQLAPGRGFTLIELMIVIGVIGLLAAVALPSFVDSVRKGRRADAFGVLTLVQQAQERWRANRGAYADHAALSTAPPDGLNIPGSTQHYDVALSDVSASGYTVTATAKSSGPQASDSACKKLVLRQQGGNIFYTSKNSADADSTSAGRCWSR